MSKGFSRKETALFGGPSTGPFPPLGYCLKVEDLNGLRHVLGSL